jgi:hypothetical protein
VSDSTNAVPPGWYPDQNAPGQQRWWDGTQWTEHVQAPYSAAAAVATLKAPEGTKTGTVWIWLIVLLPLLSLSSLFLIDWADYVDSAIASSLTGPYGGYADQLALYTSPGYLISNLMSFVLYALTVVFAVLDVRELKKRGVPQPFHWAFAFLTSIVYVIGRSVVVKRRTGGGLAPLWVYIGETVLSFIVIIIFTVLLFQYMTQAMLTQVPFPVN